MNEQTNEQVVDSMFDCCATCSKWSGSVKFIWPGTVRFDPEKKGCCNGIYMGGETQPYAHCSDWSPRF
nr:hypothetical protein DGKKSRWO_DGKKSRWO_CDS_0170 [uncultured phage]CAI9752349.1 hypothetical protein CVNMHQAP_CVNMHQAP_CDS_0172 [uncultured phage]